MSVLDWHQWHRVAERHLKLMASLRIQLQTLDTSWPSLDMAATRAVRSGTATLDCPELLSLMDCYRVAERLQRRVARLQTRMRQHIAALCEARS